jgi:hypothetical protein
MFSRYRSCLRAQRKRSQQLLGTGMFVSKLPILSCAVFGMTRFAEWEPELPGARQRAKRTKCKIRTLNIRRWVRCEWFECRYIWLYEIVRYSLQTHYCSFDDICYAIFISFHLLKHMQRCRHCSEHRFCTLSLISAIQKYLICNTECLIEV